VDTAAAAAELSACRTGDAHSAAMAGIRGNARPGPIARRGSPARETDALEEPMIGYATPGFSAHRVMSAAKASAVRDAVAAHRGGASHQPGVFDNRATKTRRTALAVLLGYARTT